MNHRNCNGDSALNTWLHFSPCICVCANSQEKPVWYQAGAWLCSCVRVDPGTAGCMGWAVVTVPVVLSSWHLEQVNWLPDTTHRNHSRLLSVATDGKILVWREERDGRLALAEGFAIVAQQIPRSTRLKKVSSAAQRVLFPQKHSEPWSPSVRACPVPRRPRKSPF